MDPEKANGPGYSATGVTRRSSQRGPPPDEERGMAPPFLLTRSGTGASRRAPTNGGDHHTDGHRGSSDDTATGVPPHHTTHPHHHLTNFHLDKEEIYHFRDRFLGRGRKPVSVRDSLLNIATSSWLNVFLLFIPLAWIAHFSRGFAHPWPEGWIFALCFLAIIPLERLFDYGGEQMALYVGIDLGDLIVVTLNNAVEATLAIILLTKCELKLLQSTIIGVIILHLLLIPGTAFITGGARIWEQNLLPHLSQLNHSLLTVGVLSLLLPAAFFAALDHGSEEAIAASVLNDHSRDLFLRMSHGLAIILLFVYVCSRIYVHNPPGDDNAMRPAPWAPEEIIHKEKKLATEDPEVKSWICIVMLIIAIALMAVTAEFLVESIEFVREGGGVQEEWFGLILLPVVSFAADGAVAIGFFGHYLFGLFSGKPTPPATLAKARAIDMSIQFVLFWMPFIVLLGWWTHKPMTLLFDLFEIAIVLASCFLVNYVTADAKTNWAEGVIMVAFYLMIAVTTWFYTGQKEIADMISCKSVAEALAGGGEHGAE